MTTKDLLKAEIDKLDPEQIEQVYQVIKQFTETQPQKSKPSLMSRLKQIKIDAPEDFSSNLDQYTSGEKSID